MGAEAGKQHPPEKFNWKIIYLPMKTFFSKVFNFLFRKEMLLLFSSLVLSCILLEVITYLYYPVKFGQSFDRDAIINKLSGNASYLSEAPLDEKDDVKSNNQRFVPHPYVGYTSYGDQSAENKFGLLGPEPLLKRSRDKLIIGITGGSVAAGFSSGLIFNPIELMPEFSIPGKKIEVVSLAVPGHKQPQQLMMLTYLLSLGGEFDIIINLDGFNEIALPYASNVPSKVFPGYPRRWKIQIQQISNPKKAALIVEMDALQTHQKKLRSFMRNSSFRESVFALTIWELYDRRLQNNIYSLNNKLTRLSEMAVPEKETTTALGPFEPFQSESDLWKFAADIWFNSSLQMERLCKANGIEYFHFLQPNQYVKDSKKFTAEEKKNAYSEEETPYKKSVIHGYPILLEHGKKLVAEGVKFKDLTNIYKNESVSIYLDKCCHVNAEGNNILRKEIGKHIRAYFEQ